MCSQSKSASHSADWRILRNIWGQIVEIENCAPCLFSKSFASWLLGAEWECYTSTIPIILVINSSIWSRSPRASRKWPSFKQHPRQDASVRALCIKWPFRSEDSPRNTIYGHPAGVHTFSEASGFWFPIVIWHHKYQDHSSPSPAARGYFSNWWKVFWEPIRGVLVCCRGTQLNSFHVSGHSGTAFMWL